jgi:hypothetical protein
MKKTRIVLDVDQNIKTLAKKKSNKKHYGNLTAYIRDLIVNDVK